MLKEEKIVFFGACCVFFSVVGVLGLACVLERVAVPRMALGETVKFHYLFSSVLE